MLPLYQILIPMKQVLFTVIGSFLLFTGTSASGNHPVNNKVAAIVKPAFAPQCNFTLMRGHRKGNGTSLTWSADGMGITKFVVSRSYDFDPYDQYAMWENIATVTADNSRSYKNDDNNVVGGNIHYRITAVMSDGSTVSSDIYTITVRKR